jgi:hypothetical protein
MLEMVGGKDIFSMRRKEYLTWRSIERESLYGS